MRLRKLPPRKQVHPNNPGLSDWPPHLWIPQISELSGFTSFWVHATLTQTLLLFTKFIRLFNHSIYTFAGPPSVSLGWPGLSSSHDPTRASPHLLTPPRAHSGPQPLSAWVQALGPRPPPTRTRGASHRGPYGSTRLDGRPTPLSSSLRSPTPKRRPLP